MGDLSWGGQIAVDHDDAFVHLEVPQEGGATVLTLEPHVARLLGRSLVSHAQSLLPRELTREDAVRAAHCEYQSTGDVHELARAVGNILGEQP